MFPGVVCTDLTKEWLGPSEHDEYPVFNITKSILLGERPAVAKSMSDYEKSPYFLDQNLDLSGGTDESNDNTTLTTL